MTTIYGIKNCDTMKKAFVWLNGQTISYEFHDYKKQGVDEKILNQAINEHGWENVINKRGTTWRNLPDRVKETMDNTKAINIAHENSSIIKRPLLLHNGQTHLGFKSETYAEIFQGI
ncbi:MAG: ArsC family reductase [Bdellovibrionales bacterium]